MIQATPSSGGSAASLGWRALVVLLSLVAAVAVWLLPPGAAPSEAGTVGTAGHQAQPTSLTTGTTQPVTTTVQATTTQPPVTDPPVTEPPATEPPPPGDEEEAPPEPDPGDEADDTRNIAASPRPTVNNVLVEGDGTSGAQATTTTEAPEDEGGSSSDDRRRLIWMIIAGLGAVALLVALLTWRYWLLTRPGLDLSDDGDDGAGPPSRPEDDHLAHRPRERRDQRAPVPAATGWGPPAGPPAGPPGPTMAAPPLPPLDEPPARWPDPLDPPGSGPGPGHDPIGPPGSGPGGRIPDEPLRSGPSRQPPPGGQVFIDAPGAGPAADPSLPSRGARPRDEGPDGRPRRGEGRGRERDPSGWDDPRPGRG